MRKFAVLALTILLLAGTFSSAQAKSKPKYAVSLSASTSSIELGASIKLSGKVSPRAKGKSVKIQRQYAGGSWRTVATKKLSSSGRFSVTVTPSQGGPTAYRAVKSGTSKRGTGASTVRTVNVFRWINLVTTQPDFASGDGVTRATSSINGTAFGNSLEFYPTFSRIGWDLTGRRCDIFRMYGGELTGSAADGAGYQVGLYQTSAYVGTAEVLANGADIQRDDDPLYVYKSLVGRANSHLSILFGVPANAVGVAAQPEVHCNS